MNRSHPFTIEIVDDAGNRREYPRAHSQSAYHAFREYVARASAWASRSIRVIDNATGKAVHEWFKIALRRRGDFYEADGYAGEPVSRALGLTLTSRDGIPMTGFPHFRLDEYAQKLRDAGFAVIVLDERETGKPARMRKAPA